MNFIKHVIKKYFQALWLRRRYSPAVQISQRQLFHFYSQQKEGDSKIKLADTGFKVFSQFEEDGKILFILSCIGMKTFSFVEIGSDDGLNSNCANLAFNWGYHGLFLDANPRAVSRGKYFYSRYPNPFGNKPTFGCAKITRENINDLLVSHGYRGEIDVMSIDIDGNDYWIWDAIHVIEPRIVIIETYINYGRKDQVAPYDPNYVYPGKHPQYHGASPVAMNKLGKKKGYRLIGANQLGFNFIFLRNDLGVGTLEEVNIDQILNHPSVVLDKVDPVVSTFPFENPLP